MDGPITKPEPIGLFNQPQPTRKPQRIAETSIEAGLHNALTGNNSKQKAEIIRHMQTAGEVTSDDLVMALDYPPNVIAPRLLELREAGQVIRTNRKKKTRSGVSAFIYILP